MSKLVFPLLFAVLILQIVFLILQNPNAVNLDVHSLEHFGSTFEKNLDKFRQATSFSASSNKISYSPRGIPTGDRLLHELFVQFASERESTYLKCGEDWKNFVFAEPPCYHGKLKYFLDLIRRVHILRVREKKHFYTVQIGCMDGLVNDPIYESIIAPHEHNSDYTAYSLANWDAVMVEPAFMKELTANYARFVNNSDMLESHMHFAEGAINTPSHIENGKCTFFSVVGSDKCELAPWMSQVSGLDEASLRAVFNKDARRTFENCVVKSEMDCWSLGTLLRDKGGYDLVPMTTNAIAGHVDEHKWCLRDGYIGVKNRVDAMIIDVEGFDGDVVNMIFNSLCPALWPAMIIYEDKVVRNNEIRSKAGTTLIADGVIRTLEANGYYVLMVGEVNIAMRIGYNVHDLKHTPFPELYRNQWLHSYANTSSSEGVKKFTTQAGVKRLG